MRFLLKTIVLLSCITILDSLVLVDVRAKSPENFKSPFTAKQYLQDVEKAAKEFNSKAHLVLVDKKDTIEFLNRDGLAKRWRYYYKDKTAKKGKRVFAIILDEKEGLRGTKSPMIIGTISDKGDVVSKWEIDSDKAYQIAWENGGGERAKNFAIKYISYDLGYKRIKGVEVFERYTWKLVWKVEFNYENTSEGGYVHSLCYYIDAETGEILDQSDFKNMSDVKVNSY